MALLVLGADVKVTLAPDQPIPHIYPGAPVILELQSTADVDATVLVEITSNRHPPAQMTLGPVTLRADRPYWARLDGVSTLRGRYHARIRVTGDGMEKEVDRIFCRIDRPLVPSGRVYSAYLSDLDDKTLAALSGFPLGMVHLAAGPGVESLAEKTVAAGFQVVFALEVPPQQMGPGTGLSTFSSDGQSGSSGMDAKEDWDTHAEALSRRFAGRVAGWELDVGAEPQRLARLVAAIRRGGSRAPIGAVVPDKETLIALLSQRAGGYVGHVVYDPDTPKQDAIATLTDAAATLGHEGLVVHAVCRCVDPGDSEAGPALVKHLLTNRARGVAHIAVHGAILYSEGTLQEGYPYLSALIQRFQDTIYVGELDLSPTADALVFRQGPGWVIATWTTEASEEATLPLGSVDEPRLTDGLNNPLRVPAVTDGAMTLTLSNEPLYLSGRGGAVVRRGALCKVATEAGHFVGNAEFQNSFPGQIVDLVASFTKASADPPDRLSFFALLRLFPVVENEWRTGNIPATVAVPALASLARIARSLCIVEQEKGEPFLEPLAQMVTRCSDRQTAYLTSTVSGSGASERGDWLLAEVSRLVAEAKALAREGRPIEASAVAALAKWRADALKLTTRPGPVAARPMAEPGPEEALETETRGK